jgi:hypothetical protein
MVMSLKGLGPEKEYAGEGQQHMQKTDPSSRQRGRPTKSRSYLSKSNKYLSRHEPHVGLDMKIY